MVGVKRYERRGRWGSITLMSSLGLLLRSLIRSNPRGIVCVCVRAPLGVAWFCGRCEVAPAKGTWGDAARCHMSSPPVNRYGGSKRAWVYHMYYFLCTYAPKVQPIGVEIFGQGRNGIIHFFSSYSHFTGAVLEAQAARLGFHGTFGCRI